MAKRASIRDIAEAMQVSISTISAVLNGKAAERRISDPLRDKILKYAKQINYQPNMLARGLRTGKSNIVCMLVEDISDPFFAAIAREMEKQMASIGYKIFYSSTENDLDIAQSLIQTYRDRQVDAYIIAPTPGLEKTIESLEAEQLPVVIFDRNLPKIETHNVLIDNLTGTLNATRQLVESGRKNIALVTLDSKQTQMMDRLKGYQDAIKNEKQKPIVLKLNYNRGVDDITPQLKDFFIKNASIDAILFTTNYLTASGLKALKNIGKSIPNDVAVIGYDDNTNFSLYTPTITAVSQPTKEIVVAIKNILQKLLTGKIKGKKETVLLPTTLIQRESS
ncbi:MAG: LacI family transcriptional regulator [Pseudopedobacter saltans]|uniref:LacI family transcriptional regulator n=1 Tax=Pseudopedobacter saltans TaxID=151895 RepID=A0A2W5FF94_9SPHI|nr:MAG: LacI family transcriptional regulator [Pseudopedobacter saltans]